MGDNGLPFFVSEPQILPNIDSLLRARRVVPHSHHLLSRTAPSALTGRRDVSGGDALERIARSRLYPGARTWTRGE